MKVYKYPLGPLEDMVTIEMPRGAEVLTVQMQAGSPFVWALVNPDAPKTKRRFRIVGTGHDLIPSDKSGVVATNYIGTIQMHGGKLVFHVFEWYEAVASFDIDADIEKNEALDEDWEIEEELCN